MSEKTMNEGVAAIGIDLSDRTGRFCAIDDEGKKIAEGTTALRTPELEKWARSIPPTVVAIEAGTHSPWISRLLERCGHEVIVANPVKVALITKNIHKTDPVAPSIWRDWRGSIESCCFRFSIEESKRKSICR